MFFCCALFPGLSINRNRRRNVKVEDLNIVPSFQSVEKAVGLELFSDSIKQEETDDFESLTKKNQEYQRRESSTPVIDPILSQKALRDSPDLGVFNAESNGDYPQDSFSVDDSAKLDIDFEESGSANEDKRSNKIEISPSTEQLASSEQPVKRGRGRPRKNDTNVRPKVKLERRRGRPKKHEGEDGILGSIRKPRNINNERSDILPAGMGQRYFTHHLGNLNSQRKAIHTEPLIELKGTKRSKPLYINIERIFSREKQDKRTKINTLDVIKHLVATFEPPVTGQGSYLLNQELREYFLSYLGHISDAHDTIRHLTQEINTMQKKKAELRSGIYQLKDDHANISGQINLTRQNYHQHKLDFAYANKINQQLDMLEREAFSGNTHSPSDDQLDHLMPVNLSEQVLSELLSISKITPSQLYKKIRSVNDVLQEIDEKIS